MIGNELILNSSPPIFELVYFLEKPMLIKTNLHSIRFLPVFVRFFLRVCFSVKKYALFHAHFCKSISALSKLLHIDKNFDQILCV